MLVMLFAQVELYIVIITSVQLRVSHFSASLDPIICGC